MDWIRKIVLLGLILSTINFFLAKLLKQDSYGAMLWMIVLGNILILLEI